MKPGAVLFSFLILLLMSTSLYPQANYYLTPEALKGRPPINNESGRMVPDFESNFREHQQKINSLRMEGRSDKDIITILNSSARNIGGGSISGRIYKADGVTPLGESCPVILFDTYGQDCGAAYSAVDGTYSIMNIPGGTYYLKTDIGHYYKNEFYNNSQSWRTADLIVLTEGQTLTGIDFSLDMCSGKISGIVKNKSDMPLEGVWVYASETFGLSYGTGITKADGTYEINYLTTGFYKVKAVHETNPHYAACWYDNVYRSADASVVPVTELLDTKNINFTLQHGGTILGEIFKPIGTLLEPYNAFITLVDENGFPISMTTTESGGKYYFYGISPGFYKIYFKYNGAENITNLWNGDAADFNSAPLIEVVPEDTVTADFHLQEGGIIEGSISMTGGTFNGNVDLSVYKAGISQSVKFTTSSNGLYSIKGLLPGSYKIKAYTYNLNPQWYNSKNNLSTADEVTITGTETINNINFTFDLSGVLGGYVSFNGGPVTGGYVGVVDLEYNQVKDARVNSIYSVTNIKPGEYKLYYSTYSDEYASQWYNDKYSFESADIVTAGTALIRLNNFTLRAKGSLQGFVSDEHNNRISGEKGMIALFIYDALTGSSGLNDYISPVSFTGGYKLSSNFGSYKLAIINYQINSEDEMNSRSVGYYGGGISFDDPAADIVLISSTGPVTLNNIILKKSAGSLSGTIYINSVPAEERFYQIIVFDETGHIAALAVYGSERPGTGHYKITGLNPGKYYVVAGVEVSVEVGTLFQWYKGDLLSPMNLMPAMNIPANLEPVIVGNGDTPGIDFRHSLTSAEDINKEYSFRLEQNYPNPFNPSTNIRYSVPSASRVTIKIYDILGKEAAQLVNEEKTPGDYQLNWDASKLSSGIYFCRMQSGPYTEIKKMVLIK